MAHRAGKQSEADIDNRLFFREQWMLLFSKAKMATTNFSQPDLRVSRERI